MALRINAADPRTFVGRAERQRRVPRLCGRRSRHSFVGLGRSCGWLFFCHVSRQHIGMDDLYIPYRNRVAAGDGDLFLVVPFEAVARRNHIGCGRHFQRVSAIERKDRQKIESVKQDE